MLPLSAYQALFNSAPLGEVLLSPVAEPVILEANQAFLKMTARRREDLIGQALFNVFGPAPDSGENPGMAAMRASLGRVIATRQPDSLPLQRYPIQATAPDGSVFFEERYWRVVNTPLFGEDGSLLCISHRSEDITVQARLEDVLRRHNERQTFLLELSDRISPLSDPDAIIGASIELLGQRLRLSRVQYAEVDDEHSTFYVPQDWTNHGLSSIAREVLPLDVYGAEIIATLRAGKPMIVNDAHTDPRTAPHAAAYDAIGVRANLALPLVKDGRLVTILSLHQSTVRNWTGQEVDMTRDVAERTWAACDSARARATLRTEREERLRDANRRKDEFLAMLAHELRNPLAPISAAASLMEMSPGDAERVRQTSQVISRQVGHMTGLIDDLLDMSRVARGLVTVSKTQQDLRMAIAGAVEQVRPMLEKHQQRLTFDLTPEDAFVLGDQKRLIQIVTNLLTNATKYTPQGGHIALRLTASPASLTLTVTDDGIGIEPSMQARVFELFEQAERNPDRAQGGLGLGLALVRHLVELHGGSVSCFSNGLGTGSTFTVMLPRLHHIAAPPPAVVEDAANNDAAKRLRVLVVDDNVDAADMLNVLLDALGHDVQVAHEATTALSLAHRQTPDVGLFDIGLPDIDGNELARRFRADPATSGSILIALSGYGQEHDKRKAREAGFDHYLVKPVDTDVLAKLLTSIPT